MERSLKILASCRTPETAEAIQSVLGDVDGVRLDLRNGALVGQLKGLSSNRSNDIIVIDLDLGNDAEIAELSDVVHSLRSDVPVIATSDNASVDKIRLLMRLGVADFLPQPITRGDLLNSLAATARRPTAAGESERPRGRVVSFIRPSGGMGATVLAVQAAYSLAQDRKRPYKVCLVDLDLQGGNAGLYLDINSDVGVFDCLTEPERFDSALVRSAVTQHKAGFDVLPAPQSLVGVDSVSTESVLALLDALRDEYEVVVVDTPPTLNPWVEALLTESDVIALVTQLTVAGVRQAARQLTLLSDQGIDVGSVQIIVNRAQTGLFASNDVSLKKAEIALQRHISAAVSSNFAVVSRAINQGRAVPQVHRGTSLERSIRRWIRRTVQDLAIVPAVSPVGGDRPGVVS